MIMTENKWFIAYDESKENKIYHNGLAIEGTAFTTGMPTVEWFTSYEAYTTRLYQLGIEYVEEDLPNLEEIKARLLSQLPSIRDKKRNSGFAVQGVKFYTDKNSVNDLALKVLEFVTLGATDDAPFVNWKGEDGWRTEWTLGEAKQAIVAISAFVQKAYDAELMSQENIASETNAYVLQFKTAENIFNKFFDQL